MKSIFEHNWHLPISGNLSSNAQLAGRSAEETVLLWLVGIGLLILLPLAYLHYLEQHWALMSICLVNSALGTLIALYVWFTRDVRIGGLTFTLVCMLCMLLAMPQAGANLVYWAYPGMAAAYFFIPVRWGMFTNGVWTVAMLPVLTAELPTLELSRCIATLVLMNIVTCIYVSRLQAQRDRLSELANLDPLTGVGNRRALEIRLQEVLGMLKRREDPASMLLLDVDHFKQINDRHGHASGDRVLVGLARVVGSRIRSSDSLFRFGGDEFVVLLQDTPQPEALAFADRLRELVAASIVQLGCQATISVGVAQVKAEETADAWLQRADRALLQAKQAGRDRACWE